MSPALGGPPDGKHRGIGIQCGAELHSEAGEDAAPRRWRERSAADGAAEEDAGPMCRRRAQATREAGPGSWHPPTAPEAPPLRRPPRTAGRPANPSPHRARTGARKNRKPAFRTGIARRVRRQTAPKSWPTRGRVPRAAGARLRNPNPRRGRRGPHDPATRSLRPGTRRPEWREPEGRLAPPGPPPPKTPGSARSAKARRSPPADATGPNGRRSYGSSGDLAGRSSPRPGREDRGEKGVTRARFRPVGWI